MWKAAAKAPKLLPLCLQFVFNGMARPSGAGTPAYWSRCPG